jgi:hypothetical protein
LRAGQQNAGPVSQRKPVVTDGCPANGPAQVNLVVTYVDDIPALEDLLRSVHDLNVTVVQPLRA